MSLTMAGEMFLPKNSSVSSILSDLIAGAVPHRPLYRPASRSSFKACWSVKYVVYSMIQEKLRAARWSAEN